MLLPELFHSVHNSDPLFSSNERKCHRKNRFPVEWKGHIHVLANVEADASPVIEGVQKFVPKFPE
jgi:hypothetical protein